MGRRQRSRTLTTSAARCSLPFETACWNAITSTICWRASKENSATVSKVVGIDLGTTNSLVAYVKNGVPVVIRDASGDGLVPSVVSVGEDGTIYVGREAQRRLLTDAQRTVYSVKRFMGKGREDVQDEARPLSVPRRRRSAAAWCGSASATASSRRRRSPRSCCAS